VIFNKTRMLRLFVQVMIYMSIVMIMMIKVIWYLSWSSLSSLLTTSLSSSLSTSLSSLLLLSPLLTYRCFVSTLSGMIVQSVSCQEGKLYCIDNDDHTMIIIIIHWTIHLSHRLPWVCFSTLFYITNLSMYSSIHLPIHPSIHPSIYLSTHLSVYLFHQFINLRYPSIFLPISFIYPSTYLIRSYIYQLYIHLFILLFIHLPVQPSIHLIYISIHSSIYLIYISIMKWTMTPTSL
jgi:hypothetical protein